MRIGKRIGLLLRSTNNFEKASLRIYSITIDHNLGWFTKPWDIFTRMKDWVVIENTNNFKKISSTSLPWIYSITIDHNLGWFNKPRDIFHANWKKDWVVIEIDNFKKASSTSLPRIYSITIDHNLGWFMNIDVDINKV